MMRQQKTVVSYGRAYVIRQKNRRRRRKYKWLCMGIGLLFVLVFLLKPNVQAERMQVDGQIVSDL